MFRLALALLVEEDHGELPRGACDVGQERLSVLQLSTPALSLRPLRHHSSPLLSFVLTFVDGCNTVIWHVAHGGVQQC